MSRPVDVLGLIDRIAGRMMMSAEASVARDAIEELVESDREYDAAMARRIEADNRITTGDRSDEAFRQQATTHHAYDRAADRRRAALARIKP